MINVFHQFLPRGSHSLFPFQCHPHILTEITLVFDEQTYIPNLVLFPIQALIKLPVSGQQSV